MASIVTLINKEFTGRKSSGNEEIKRGLQFTQRSSHGLLFCPGNT